MFKTFETKTLPCTDQKYNVAKDNKRNGCTRRDKKRNERREMKRSLDKARFGVQTTKKWRSTSLKDIRGRFNGANLFHSVVVQSHLKLLKWY